MGRWWAGSVGPRWASARRPLAWAFGCALACACPDPPAPPPEDDGFHERVMAEVKETHEKYRTVIDGFTSALAAQRTDTAYALLAPVYRNMVSEASFKKRILQNQNFTTARQVKVLGTSTQAGTTKVSCVFGDLGLSEVVLVDGPAGPRIASLSIAGAPALPTQE